MVKQHYSKMWWMTNKSVLKRLFQLHIVPHANVVHTILSWLSTLRKWANFLSLPPKESFSLLPRQKYMQKKRLKVLSTSMHSNAITVNCLDKYMLINLHIKSWIRRGPCSFLLPIELVKGFAFSASWMNGITLEVPRILEILFDVSIEIDRFVGWAVNAAKNKRIF